MTTSSVKVILLIGFGLSAFIAQAQSRPEPVEPKVEVEVMAPLVKVAPGDIPLIKINKGHCNLNNEQRDIAWKNVLEALAEKYPEHSKYCETTSGPATKMFIVVNDICRTRIQCAKNVDGLDIVHGDFIVEVDETTLEVRRFIDVAWQTKP